MLHVTSGELNGLLAAYLFPFTRIAGFFAVAPVFGQLGMPMRSRLVVVLALTFLIVPSMPNMQTVPASPHFMPLFIMQALIGIALGMVVRVVFAAIELSGDLIGFQMSLSFASAFNPDTGSQSPIVGSFMLWIGAAIFICMDGHLVLLATLLESFSYLPPDKIPDMTEWGRLVRSGSILFSLGLQIALPIVIPLIIANIGLALLTRTAPSLNLFSIGFPLVLATGFFFIWMSFPYLAGTLEYVYQQALGSMREVLSHLAS